MHGHKKHGLILATTLVVALSILGPWSPASAHCDSVDGPIVPAALQALESGELEPVLRWVSPGDEDAVVEAFTRARAVREQGDEARDLAEQWFLETLIRLHREGEGEVFTGLKPAGSIEPVYQQADAALQEGEVHHLSAEFAEAVRAQITERFSRALEARAHADHSVEAGRSYVAAYVDYMHFVEGLDRLLRHHESHGSAGPGHEHAD